VPRLPRPLALAPPLGALLVLLVAVGGPPRDEAADGPFFVIAGAFREKPAAQAQARRTGGWVLRTDLYERLTPGFFGVVHGPFARRADAETALRPVLRQHSDAYVRSAGASVLPPALGDPALLAALLGEVRATVHDGARPVACAPPEAHLTVTFGTVAPGVDAGAATVGGFWVIQRTGEIRPIRPCAG
jgi:hypothetical protein